MTAFLKSMPADIVLHTKHAIQTGLDTRQAETPVNVFLRADDIGVPGAQFARMMDLFVQLRVPLSLAVVPAWITRARWQALAGLQQGDDSLFTWHQHGWRHRNHEPVGKKQEFGLSRPADVIRSDLLKGKTRLETILGRRFTPIFTPPWNRCSRVALDQLRLLKYKAVSRSRNSSPPAPAGFPDFQVNVDLHTRKEGRAREGWRNLLSELSRAIAAGTCGIMIHHQRMNDNAFSFLELLLELMIQQKKLSLLHMPELDAYG
ncbi:MAG: polysaccharide deacetylase family protein [Desulfobacteraceae bacterium]|nr:polysaccharide deacetylase family protein [Desulfobacteraceae bacterium]